VGGHSLRDMGIDIRKIGSCAILLFISSSTGYLIFKYMQEGRTTSSSRQLEQLCNQEKEKDGQSD